MHRDNWKFALLRSAALVAATLCFLLVPTASAGSLADAKSAPVEDGDECPVADSGWGTVGTTLNQ